MCPDRPQTTIRFSISDNVNVSLDIIYWRDEFEPNTLHAKSDFTYYFRDTSQHSSSPLKSSTKFRWRHAPSKTSDFAGITFVWITFPKSLFINNRKKNNSEVYGAVLPSRLVCLKKIYCLKLLLYHSTCLWIFKSLKLLL